MAALTTDQIKKIWYGLSDIIAKGRPVDLTRIDFEAAVVAVNTWIDANAVSFNNALPANVKARLSAAEKSALFHLVAKAKYGG